MLRFPRSRNALTGINRILTLKEGGYRDDLTVS